jgi:hypothetical protein
MHQSRRIFGSSITALVLSLSLCEPVSASCVEAEPTQGPIVRNPVSPKSSDTPVQEMMPAPQWKPGDPVQVRPDLKSSSQPRVSDSITKKTKESPTVAPPSSDERL